MIGRWSVVPAAWFSVSILPHPAAPLMMNQVDAEMGYSGRPMMMQQPVAAAVAEDDITGADLVRHAVHSHITLHRHCNRDVLQIDFPVRFTA